MTVGIFGSGSAALRYLDILRAQRVNAFIVRENKERLIRNNVIYPTIDIRELKNIGSVIIASATESRLIHLKSTLEANIKHILIEKPLFTRSFEENLIKSIDLTDSNIYSGDQYYHDDLIEVVRSLTTSKQIEVCFSEFVNNVTKGRKNSYALREESGGAKWTFSHSMFVALEYLRRFGLLDPKKHQSTSVMKQSLMSYHARINFYNASVVLKNNFLTHNKNSLFSMKVTEPDGTYYVCDFKNRMLIKNGAIIYRSKYDRMDLIARNVQSFINFEQHEQFEVSLRASQILRMG